MKADPVGVAEIAERLGVRPQTAHVWRYRKLLPNPRWTVSGQPAWNWDDIERWARETGRLTRHVAGIEYCAECGFEEHPGQSCR